MTSAAWSICREIRARRGWTQRQLAAAAGVPPATIARIEKARMEPTLALLSKIARAAGFELTVTIASPDADEQKARAAARSLSAEGRLNQNRRLSHVWAEAKRQRVR